MSIAVKEERKRIREAFQQLEERNYKSSFILSLQKQFKQNGNLSHRQTNALLEILNSLQVTR